jgi:mannose-1-phosphate guanylyltransferase
MKALLLAAGFGSRLRPLTDSVPKCLVPIGGRPLLEIWLSKLARAGIGPYLINTHYLNERVESFVTASEYAKDVSLVRENILLGTAGTLKANLGFFNGRDGLLVHADNYCDADIRCFVDAHRSRPKHCQMTMMTFRTDTPSSCGIVELDHHGVVQAFHEKSTTPPGDLANGPVYILSAELLRRMDIDFRNAVDFSTQVIPRLMGRIYAHEVSEIFLDIGTPESYEQACRIATAVWPEATSSPAPTIEKTRNDTE